MDLRDFAKYIRGKSIDKLLHRARKSSLKRILASEKELTVFGRSKNSITWKLTIRTLCFLLSMLGLLPAGAKSAVYSCRDDQGVVHYSNTPCEREEKENNALPPLTYEAIIKANASMTSAQFDAYVGSIKGREMRGKGRVQDIISQGEARPIVPAPRRTEIYVAIIQLDTPPPPDRSGVQRRINPGIDLQLPNTIALQMKNGEFIAFRGNVDSVFCAGTTCRVSLKDGRIE